MYRVTPGTGKVTVFLILRLTKKIWPNRDLRSQKIAVLHAKATEFRKNKVSISLKS
jgi:hypothetical protein